VSILWVPADVALFGVMLLRLPVPRDVRWHS
jgi:hypothetical protein